MHMNNDSYIIQVLEDVYEKKLSSNHTTDTAVVVTFDCLQQLALLADVVHRFLHGQLGMVFGSISVFL